MESIAIAGMGRSIISRRALSGDFARTLPEKYNPFMENLGTPAAAALNPSFIIARKRDGAELTRDEINCMISGFTAGTIPDYQISAWAMAIFLRGMSPGETAILTDSMLRSGTLITKPPGAVWVDKHSTGGIGDKVSLLLAPLLACCELQVPMISGRGLGATGGTLDKLESIPGFRTDLSIDELQRITARVGCVISGASEEIAPADKRLYALRDVTATVASIPLITASIMSKKLAENLSALTLDVKYGSGAFMKRIEDAERLATSLVETGKRMGVQTSALITDMNQPLGRMVGNAVEVDETITALQGQGPADLLEVTLALGAELMVLTGRAVSHTDAKSQLLIHVTSGRALQKLAEMVEAQGGDLWAPRAVAPRQWIASRRSGFVQCIDTEKLGQIVIELGGGRRFVSDKIDHSVGLEMLVRIGDRVSVNQPLVHVFANSEASRGVHGVLDSAIVIGDAEVGPPTMIVRRIE